MLLYENDIIPTKSKRKLKKKKSYCKEMIEILRVDAMDFRRWKMICAFTRLREKFQT